MSITSHTTRADVVEQIARDNGYGEYASIARQVGDSLPTDRPVTGYDVRDAARHAGLGYSVPEHLVSFVVSAVNRTEVTDAEPEDTPVDPREERAETIRNFAVGSGANAEAVEEALKSAGLVYDHDRAVTILRQFATSAGLSEEQAEQALVEVGMVEPAPEPEPEPEEEERTLFQRLVDWARGQGFRG